MIVYSVGKSVLASILKVRIDIGIWILHFSLYCTVQKF